MLFGHEEYPPPNADREARARHELALVGALRINDLIDGVERINAFLSNTAKASQKAAASRGKYFRPKRR